MKINLTEKNKKDLLLLVRMTIAEKLNISMPDQKEEPDFSDPVFSEKYGAFVTLHCKGNLRGCIGYIQGYLPLKETIVEMAQSAAFHDPRFAPLSVQEFPLIDIEISVLSPIEPLENFNDIVIGRDGLIASRGRQSGLLLPQVAAEYGWSVEEFLSHTCMKGGFPADEWRSGSVGFQKFSAYVFGEKEHSEKG